MMKIVNNNNDKNAFIMVEKNSRPAEIWVLFRNLNSFNGTSKLMSCQNAPGHLR
jgi:hypothetical protein